MNFIFFSFVFLEFSDQMNGFSRKTTFGIGRQAP